MQFKKRRLVQAGELNLRETSLFLFHSVNVGAMIRNIQYRGIYKEKIENAQELFFPG